MNKAVFLDRDGVINRKAPEGQYITRWEDWEFLPGAARAISSLNAAGFLVIVVTNQRCVARGLLTEWELEALHQHMSSELAALGAPIFAVYYCPHDKEPPCECRKPSPAMLLTAAREHDIDLTSSWMVGDSEKDIEAGRRAGCRTVHIAADNSGIQISADLQSDSLIGAVPGILGVEKSVPATGLGRESRW